MRRRLTPIAALLTLACTAVATANTQPAVPPTRATGGAITLHQVLIHPPTAKPVPGLPLVIDPVQAALGRGTFTLDPTWTLLQANDKGEFEAEALSRGGWAYAEVESDAERVMLLRAAGHSMVYVNGEPRAGDVYHAGYLALPVKLRKGGNSLLFQAGRGKFRARLEPLASDISILTDDATMPDLVEGVAGLQPFSLVIVNGTEAAVSPTITVNAGEVGKIEVRDRRGNSSATLGELAITGRSIPPLSIRKVPLVLATGNQTQAGPISLRVGIAGGPAVDLKVNVRRPDEMRKVTFVSDIDGSVQYYALRPATREPLPPPATRPVVGPLPATRASSPMDVLWQAIGRAAAQGLVDVFSEIAQSERRDQARSGAPAIVLSLHGASVEATNQANAYASKPWAHIVCPTNRRPYGFDWEEWGRLDALEALADARMSLPYDPSRIHLTGHSMGGHGTYHLAVNHPGMFAAMAPSAGWIQWSTYVPQRAPATQRSARADLDAFRRASLPLDTLALAGNLRATSVFLLHGDADDNVPVGQARQMARLLQTFHHDWTLHEEKGAGHWWSRNKDDRDGGEPGASCVDFPAIFDLFARRRLPAPGEVREVAFMTANPAVHSKTHWAEIVQQERSGELSSVDLHLDPHTRKITGTTSNVARLAIDLDALGYRGKPVTFEINGVITTRGTSEAQVEWDVTLPAAMPGRLREPFEKNPKRAGPLKAAIGHRFALVYATGGTAEENALAYQKARFDAESWYYRGNGSADVVPDTDGAVLADKDRTVVLYGNADTHRLWGQLLANSPVQVRRSGVTVGAQAYPGEASALFCQPRPGSDVAMVVAIAPTTVRAARAHLRLPVLAPGVAWPDYAVIGAESLETGGEAVWAGSFFNNRWEIEADGGATSPTTTPGKPGAK